MNKIIVLYHVLSFKFGVKYKKYFKKQAYKQ